jgi:hypothetical protein
MPLASAMWWARAASFLLNDPSRVLPAKNKRRIVGFLVA